MSSDVTRILNAIERGDAGATDELLPLVYEELRLLAAQKLDHEKPGQTLQATALVHGAYIRLVGDKPQTWENRGHFFAAAAEALGVGDEEAAKALLAAGLIGILVAFRTTFAAEVCGCQAECGVASGMTAAALISLAGAGIHESVTAASMALQNSLGMICDPVVNRVEVPCLGKNVMAAANALTCANMALAGYDPVIPLDEVIETMDRVGRSLPRELRCTGLGGLSTTWTSREIEACLQRPPRYG